MSFYEFPSPWDHFNPVQIEKTSETVLQDLRQIVEYTPQNESQTFWKFHFQHFC